jgi:fatty-acyl-CoA synthase
MTGTKLVMPGPKLDGASLTELMAAEGVTMAAGVPTVWMGLIAHWRQSGTRVPSLERVIVGGSAAPRAMLDAFREEFGIEARHAWGMTEMSPLGTTSVLDPAMDGSGEDDRAAIRGKQGRAVFGVEMKIVDEAGNPLPHDGKAFGDLRVRGPWVAGSYYRLEGSAAHDADGWFSTGDVATIDPHGYMNVTDRLKDLIKSGGEWISSIDLENLAAGHPDVAQAAVIAVADERWGERPLLIVVARSGASPARDSLLAYFAGKVPKFWIPDDVLVVDALPLGATGKVLKSRLREEYGRRRPG